MKRHLFLSALFLALAALPAAAQPRTITGRVTAQDTNAPLPNVQVVAKGTTTGVLTNASGTYTLTLPVGATTLVFSAPNYAQREVLITGDVMNVTLAPSAVGLEGLVVTATGQEQRLREQGSAISTVNVAETELAPVTNMSQLLQGRVPGATIMQSSGQAGAGSRVRIRGSNSISLSNAPLIIVDGVRVQSTEGGEAALGFGVGGQTPSRLNDINPEDIENIEILKGPAAAALYGTAAANGVIQVTTRRGRAGRPEFRAWSELGAFERTGDFPTNVISLGNLVALDAAGNLVSNGVGRCDIIRQAIDSHPTGNQVGCTGVTETFSFNPLENDATTPFRTGRRFNTGASISGGNEGTTFYLSGSYEDEIGVTKMNNLQRIRLQANTTGQFGSHLRVGSNVSYLNNHLQLPQSDNALFGITGMGLSGSALPANVEEFQGYSDDPRFFTDWKTFQYYGRLQGSVRGDYRPWDWLSINGTAGLDRYSREDQNRIPRNTVYSVFGGVYEHGFIQDYTYDIWDLTTNASATATYNATPDILLTSAIGTQYLRENFHRIYAFGAGLTPGVETSLAGATSDFEAGEFNIRNGTVSAYAQQQFAWRDRVFLNAALRGDKNTAFGTDIGWIAYPSLSGSWVVSEEPFFPTISSLNTLRLRAAYGQSGLRPGPTDALQAFSPVVTTFNAADVAAITFNLIGNPELRPERTAEWELGFESGWLENRLGLEATYFHKTSRNALISRPLPPSLGSAVSRFENLGKVLNSGLELALNAQPVHTTNLEWNAKISGSFLHNKLIDLGRQANGEPIPDIVFGIGSTQRHREGFPLGSYFHFPIISFADTNGDGLLDPSEVVVRTDTVVFLGNPLPKREFSFTTDLSYRGWLRLSTLFDYKGGHRLLNASRAWRCSTNRDFNCAALYDRNTPLDVQAAIIAQSFFNAYTGFIEKADFVKWRELSLTFVLPRRYVQQFGARGLSLTLAGRNLHTWTDYSGLDPEVNFAGQSNFTTADFSTLPPNRFYSIRLDVNF